MQANTSSASEAKAVGTRIVTFGIVAVVLILGIAGALLLWNLPDANAFNARVERLFVENADLTSAAEIKLLEILAQSGTAFSEVLASYRLVIFVLMLFATGLLVASLVFVVTIVSEWIGTRTIPLGPGTVRRLGTPEYRMSCPAAGDNSNDIEEQAAWRA